MGAPSDPFGLLRIGCRLAIDSMLSSSHVDSMLSKMKNREVVHFLALERFPDWEAAHALAALDNPFAQKRPGRFRTETVGITAEPVRSRGGLSVQPDSVLQRLSPHQSAILIVPGSDLWEQREMPEVMAKVREFLAAKKPVAAICGATLALAKAGLLDERRHTSNAPEYLAATRYRGAKHYDAALAVTDGDLITASSMGALEFAREILRKLDVYESQVLEAWYQLFKTGDPKHHATLMAASS
jgi:putative intracellular protease/amidase